MKELRESSPEITGPDYMNAKGYPNVKFFKCIVKFSKLFDKQQTAGTYLSCSYRKDCKKKV
jgi:hypothetical protein